MRNIRSLSEENLQFINYQSENYYEKNFGEKENKKPKSIHSLLFDNPKFIGYKSPMSFLKHNKMITKKLLKKYKPINPYNYLNIFSNNKKFDSIGEFIENFNSINNKKISFYTLNSDKTTTTKFKTNTISSNISSKKKKQKHRLFSSKLNDEDNHNTIISLRDFLIDLIEQQKRLIKEIENKKAEEIRSHNQIKTFISDCINDLSIEIFEIKEENKYKENKEDLINYNEKLIYILSYIFDNCFSGIKYNIKKLINKSRNNINNDIKLNNIDSFFDSNDISNIKLKKSFSLNDINYKLI